MWLQSSGSSSGVGWLQEASCACLAVRVGGGGATCFSSRLAQAFLWSGSIPREQSQCISDFQVSTYILFISIPWTKASHAAQPRVHVQRDYAKTWIQGASFIGAIMVTITVSGLSTNSYYFIYLASPMFSVWAWCFKYTILLNLHDNSSR